MVSIARIERPPFYRGGSASTETMPATSLSLPLFREQEDDQAALGHSTTDSEGDCKVFYGNRLAMPVGSRTDEEENACILLRDDFEHGLAR